MAQNFVKPLALSTFNATGLTTAYQALNGTGFTEPVFFMRIVNDTTKDLTVSFDGSTDHDFIPAGAEYNFPSQANAQPPSQLALWKKGTVIYVKSDAAGTGLIGVSAYYV